MNATYVNSMTSQAKNLCSHTTDRVSTHKNVLNCHHRHTIMLKGKCKFCIICFDGKRLTCVKQLISKRRHFNLLPVCAFSLFFHRTDLKTVNSTILAKFVDRQFNSAGLSTVQKEIQTIDKIYLFYRKSPNSHPAYENDWRDFYKKRREELLAGEYSFCFVFAV